MKLYLKYSEPEVAYRMFKSMWPSFWNTCTTSKAILTIKEDKLTRSQKQNKLYWKWLRVIHEETDQPIEDYFEGGNWHKGLHTKFKCDFIGKYYYDDGSLKIPSTKELKVQQFSDYLEKVNMFSSELGIKLPQPEEKL